MVPEITLVVVTLVARLAGWMGWNYTDSWPASIAHGLAAMFLVTGIAHFVQPLRGGLIAIVPAQLPAPGALVTITGILQLIGVVGLLLPQTRVVAAICLFLLMLAMYPANIYASRAKRSEHAPNTPLLRRWVVEVLFLAGAAVVAIGSA